MSVLSPNAGKYEPEKLQIQTLNMWWKTLNVGKSIINNSFSQNKSESSIDWIYKILKQRIQVISTGQAYNDKRNCLVLVNLKILIDLHCLSGNSHTKHYYAKGVTKAPQE